VDQELVRRKDIRSRYTLLRERGKHHRENALALSTQAREAYERMDVDAAHELSQMEKWELMLMRTKNEEPHYLIFGGQSQRQAITLRRANPLSLYR
jgi:hypothetical protein